MNIITKKLHIWRLSIPLYYCGELTIWADSHCKISFVLFGHAIRIY